VGGTEAEKLLSGESAMLTISGQDKASQKGRAKYTEKNIERSNSQCLLAQARQSAVRRDKDRSKFSGPGGSGRMKGEEGSGRDKVGKHPVPKRKSRAARAGAGEVELGRVDMGKAD
jgi:hypothetical protein